MKKHIPTIMLAISTIVLAAELYKSKSENKRLREDFASAGESRALPGRTAPESEVGSERLAGDPDRVLAGSYETNAPEADTATAAESNRRMMSSISKMMEDNPTINKMVEASQRGAIGALYSDMIEYLGLDKEETQYFMDLLMYRQMKNVDVHMKLMSGNLTDEEEQILMEEARLASDTTREEMEKFLNDGEDYAEFEFYEDTIGERMMLSQMDQGLGENALPDETYREVLEIMHEERENYAWSTDLNDNENRDLSPERFSPENIEKHFADIKTVGERMDQRLQTLLTPEQLEAWRQSGVAMQEMISAQLQQAAQMVGTE